MLVGQVVKTFGVLNFMNFEIENYVRYKTFQIGKNIRYMPYLTISGLSRVQK